MKTSNSLSTKKKIYKHSLSESSIQTKLLQRLRAKNPESFIVKLSDKWLSGMPDVMMITNGKVYFYEVKSNKGVLSEIQKVVHDQIRKSGAWVQVVNEDCLT